MCEITVVASLDNIATITEFVDERLEIFDCPMKAQMQIDVAIDEIVSNVVYYAYGSSEGTITVRVEKMEDPLAIKLTFIDKGIPYNPLLKEDPDITLSAEDREIGGLGIFMVRKFMDRMEYKNVDGDNIFSVWKNI